MWAGFIRVDHSEGRTWNGDSELDRIWIVGGESLLQNVIFGQV